MTDTYWHSPEGKPAPEHFKSFTFVAVHIPSFKRRNETRHWPSRLAFLEDLNSFNRNGNGNFLYWEALA